MVVIETAVHFIQNSNRAFTSRYSTWENTDWNWKESAWQVSLSSSSLLFDSIPFFCFILFLSYLSSHNTGWSPRTFQTTTEILIESGLVYFVSYHP